MRSPQYAVLAAALAPTLACAAATPAVDIPAGRLAAALTALGRQTSTDILFSETLIGDRQSPAVRGKVEAEAALSRLLAGSGLAFHRTADGAFVVNRVADGAAAAAPDDETIPEILIIGRRAQNGDIRRTEDDIQLYQVYTRRDVERARRDSLDEFARTQLPANAQIASPAQQAGGANTRSEINLRGLGANQTLVLVDGRRLPNLPKSTFSFDQPDLNGIPLEMVERIEVLTATAGGIYGNGATSGAVNVILRRDTRGAELAVTTGLTTRGDTFQNRVFGRLAFTPDQGSTDVTIAVSAARSATLRAGERDYIDRARQRRLANDPEAFIAERPVGDAINIFAASSLTLKPQFGGAALGSTYTNLPRAAASDVATRSAALVANAGTLDTSLPAGIGGRQDAVVAAPSIRSIFLNARHDFGGGVSAFVDVIDTRNKGRSALFRQRSAFDTIGPELASNPFEQTVALALPLGQYSGSYGTVLNTMRRYTAGVIVPLPGDWRANAEYGGGRARTRADFITAGLGNGYVQAFFFGQPLPGKPPLDPLGDRTSFEAALAAYATSSGFLTDQTNIFRDLNLRIAGPLLTLPDGPATLTLVAEERRETVRASQVVQTFNDAPVPSLQLPRFAERVRSLYGEARLPLTDRWGLLSRLELQLAVRQDWTSVTLPGAATFFAVDPPPFTRTRSTTLYTAGARFSPARGIVLRASTATGALPPSSSQLGTRRFGGASGLTDPQRGGQNIGTDAAVTTFTGGNAELKPERAESLSAGIVLTPDGKGGPRVSLDFTRIRKRNEIVPLPVTASALVADSSLFSSRVTRAPLTDADRARGFTGGAVTRLDLTSINLGRTRIDAVDLAYDQDFDAGALGDLIVYLRATWEPSYRQRLNDTTPPVERVGYIDGPLEWRGNGGVEWSRGRLTLGFSGQFYGRYRVIGATAQPAAIAQTVKAQGSSHIPAQLYFDLAGTYRLGGDGDAPRRSPEIRFGLLNVLDHRPPIVADPASPGYSFYGDPRRRRLQVTVDIPFGG